MSATWTQGCQCALPPDWKPANYNPDFDVDAEFEEQGSKLDLVNKTLAVFADLTSVNGTEDFKRATVVLNREELSGLFQLLHDATIDLSARNELTHKYVCNKWGYERLLAERELQEKS
jgi:hypothetical protein